MVNPRLIDPRHSVRSVFLCDWCDNEAELDTEGFLENWIDARDANSKVTGINRAFSE